MGLRIGKKGISSVVGMALMLIALILLTALVYNVLDIIHELSNLSLNGIERALVRIKVPHLVEGNYVVVNSTAILKVSNNLTEPLQVVGYIVVYRDMSYEIIKPIDRYIIPPLSTITLTSNIYEEPLCIIVVILIRDSVTHIVLKGI